jgi:hypothetical protein
MPDPPWLIVGQAGSAKGRILNEQFVMIDGNPANTSLLSVVPATDADNSCGSLVDCLIEARFQGQTGTSALNPRGGLAGRVQADDGFALLLDKNTNVALWRITNITGIARISNDIAGPVTGQWLGLQMIGNQISITFDGAVQDTVTDGSFSTGGLYGWHFHSDTLSAGMFWAFDRFRVRTL